MRAKAFTLTLRVPQGDPTLNNGNKINLPNTYGEDTNSGIKCFVPQHDKTNGYTTEKLDNYDDEENMF